MSFISYAQNFEDVMLWRALKHIGKGFYVDVGANDPDVYSVTKAFYERGWRGINIEPVGQLFEEIKQKRTRDINLNIAAGAQEGENILYEIPGTGLSTIEKEIAEQHKKERSYEISERHVQVKTLTQICQKHHEGPIHFLNIDVEGAEENVLQGLDLVVLRPWIIVIESTLPFTQIENHGKWEALLTNSNYEFAYFDGVNRFYIAQERAELKVAFDAPPNVFDDFIKYPQLYSENRARHAEGQATQAEARATQAEARATQAEARVTALLNSASWRITTPVRWIHSLLLGLSPDTLKANARSLFHQVVRYVMAQPRLRNAAEAVFDMVPTVKSRLATIFMNEAAIQVAAARAPADLATLTPRARQIYADLKAAVERRQKENC